MGRDHLSRWLKKMAITLYLFEAAGEREAASAGAGAG